MRQRTKSVQSYGFFLTYKTLAPSYSSANKITTNYLNQT